jgi:hypothetical protein
VQLDQCEHSAIPTFSQDLTHNLPLQQQSSDSNVFDSLVQSTATAWTALNDWTSGVSAPLLENPVDDSLVDYYYYLDEQEEVKIDSVSVDEPNLRRRSLVKNSTAEVENDPPSPVSIKNESIVDENDNSYYGDDAHRAEPSFSTSDEVESSQHAEQDSRLIALQTMQAAAVRVDLNHTPVIASEQSNLSTPTKAASLRGHSSGESFSPLVVRLWRCLSEAVASELTELWWNAPPPLKDDNKLTTTSGDDLNTRRARQLIDDDKKKVSFVSHVKTTVVRARQHVF